MDIFYTVVQGEYVYGHYKHKPNADSKVVEINELIKKLKAQGESVYDVQCEVKTCTFED